jgi:hypothetical protein
MDFFAVGDVIAKRLVTCRRHLLVANLALSGVVVKTIVTPTVAVAI